MSRICSLHRLGSLKIMTEGIDIVRPKNLCEIGRTLEIGIEVFPRIENFPPGTPDLISEVIRTLGKDILLGVVRIVGLFLDKGILVMIHEDTAIGQHLVIGAGTGLEINMGMVLQLTDPTELVGTHLSGGDHTMVDMHVPEAVHLDPNR